MGKILTVLVSSVLLLGACSFAHYEKSDTLIVSARDASGFLDKGYLLVDAQKATSYAKEHVKGAANVERAQITVSDPVPNSVSPASLVAEAAGKAGISSDSDLIIYDDNNNMDACRLLWTLKYYGHRGDIRVLSGGLGALKAQNWAVVAGTESISPVKYAPSPAVDSIIALKDELKSQIENPRKDVVILDVRTEEEYNAGTIPGSVHIDYMNNMFSDMTFKPDQHIKILYKQAGIMPDDEIIMYCKSSVRAANTYVALYNSGYRKLKIYDGAWLEWSTTGYPVYIPETALPTLTSSQANS